MIRLLPGDQLWDRYRVDAVGPEALDGAWLSLLRSSDHESASTADSLARYLLIPLERPARHPLPRTLHTLAKAGLLGPNTLPTPPAGRKRRKRAVEADSAAEQNLPFFGRVKLIGKAGDSGVAILTVARTSVLSSLLARCGEFTPAQSLRVFHGFLTALLQVERLAPASGQALDAVLEAFASLVRPDALSIRCSDSRLLVRTGMLHTLPTIWAPRTQDPLSQVLQHGAQVAISLVAPPGSATPELGRKFPDAFRELLERCENPRLKPKALSMVKVLAEADALLETSWASAGSACISCGFWLPPSGEAHLVCPCCAQEQSAAQSGESGSGGTEARASNSGRLRRSGGTSALVPRVAQAGVATLTVPKGMVLVPAGSFLSGERKVPRTLRSFAIDTVPVTERDYKEYLAAARKTARDGGAGSRGPQFDKFPVTHITWHEANDFAEFHSKRLPTVYEWEKAARGSDGRKYPFGNTYRADSGRIRVSQDQPRPDGPAPVGSHPSGASPCGALDMAGNVLEWTCSARRAGERFFRAVKGACYKDGTPELARCTSMQYLKPETVEPFIGFRCVKDVD